MVKTMRAKRAIENFETHGYYQYPIHLPESTRLNWNHAYDWCVEQFGEPGERWDFYYESNNVNRKGAFWLGWYDTFGFEYSEDATLFLLRWS
jgi:hypothetical protein